MARGTSTGQREAFSDLIEPVVAELGYDVEEISVSQAGRRNVVRVVVDGDDGVSLDAVAEVSRRISEALDDEAAAAPVGNAPYTLEVTSPGVDRPLTLPRHWRRNVGRLVKVRRAEGELTARITAVDESGVFLEADDRTVEIAYAVLGPGAVQVEFSRVLAPAGDVQADDLKNVGEQA
jgi:ribosome maturation factor RimP